MEYYLRRLESGSEHYQILGWEGYAQQHARFEALLRAVDVRNKSLLDVGCGLGDLYQHIREKKLDIDYMGVDILQFMTDRAGQDNPDARFVCADIFKEDIFPAGQFDIVYASGIFNLDLGNNSEFFTLALNRFYELSRSIVAFSLLHDRSPDKESLYYYYRPGQVVECIDDMGLNVKRIDILEDYAQNDFTVIIEK